MTNTNRTIARLAVFAVLTVMVTSAASAYVLLSPARKWFSTPRLVHVDNGGLASVTDGDGGVSATLGAVTAWNNAPGGPVLSVTSSQADNTAIVRGDGVSNLEFSDPFGVCSGNCIAATFTGFYNTGQTGTCGSLNVVAITDADIVFNTSFNFNTVAEGSCSSEIYLESVVTHEVGHLIGLGHSNQQAALMYPSVAFCDNKPLGTDDTAGRNALYNCSGGGGGCKPAGQTCTANGECCSGSCKGKPGAKKCK
ncbi:MAG TPA: matrixin family metalloprotease [Candidatus Polarisedimenticolia bacterium]|nr:matrixin family metalloprotease [Candidatus Polarisedimenticolia bacterium]